VELLVSPVTVCVVRRNVLSSQEVVDFVSERIKPDESGHVRLLSSIVEEVRGLPIHTECFPRIMPPDPPHSARERAHISNKREDDGTFVQKTLCI